MSEADGNDPPKQPRPVDYQSLDTEAQGRGADRRDFAVASVFSALATTATGFLFVISTVRLSGMPQPATRFGLPLAFAGIVAMLLLGIGYHRWKRRGSRAWAAGVLLGFAIGAMIEGLCFAATR